MLRFNPDAGIGHFDQDVLVHVVKSKQGTPSVPAVFDRVDQQVDQHLTYPVLIRVDIDRSVAAFFETQADIPFPRTHFQRVDGILAQLVQIEGPLV